MQAVKSRVSGNSSCAGRQASFARPRTSSSHVAHAHASQVASYGTDAARRTVLLSILSLPALAPLSAKASPLQDLTRSLVRPEISPVDAVVALIDARSTLAEIEEIAATPQDSELRFVSRKLWPAFAKRLREAGPAAPVVASIATGVDKEATLSEQYGGKAGAEPGVVDRVYIGLGNVLTISGRTIKPEAQASAKPAEEARLAIEEFLSKVPSDVYQAAQDFRVKRAAAA